MKNETAFKLEGFLPFKLNTTADIIGREFAEVYSNGHNLRRSQWRIMVSLNEHGQMTAKQICDLTYMEKVMVSRAVKELVSRKLIKRRVNKNDKRSMYLELTASGKRAIQKLIPVVVEWQALAKKKIGAKNYNTLIKLLNDVKARYEE